MKYTVAYIDRGITKQMICIEHSVYMRYSNMPKDTQQEIEAATAYLHRFTEGMDYFTEKSNLYTQRLLKFIEVGGVKERVSVVENSLIPSVKVIGKIDL